MPSDTELVNAAATLLVVAAAHVRRGRVNRRQHDEMRKQLRACALKLQDLEQRFERWTGLP